MSVPSRFWIQILIEDQVVSILVSSTIQRPCSGWSSVGFFGSPVIHFFLEYFATHQKNLRLIQSSFLLCSSLPMFAYVPNKRKRCASCPPNASSPVHASREQSKRLSTPSTCIRSGATGLRLKRISVYEGKDAISATTRWQICHKAKTSIECRDRATADQHFLRCRASMRRGA